MKAKKEKTGGRVAGTPNKRTLEALEVFGEFCPLEEIIRKLNSPSIKQEIYLQTCIKLLEYKFPKRKAIEHSVGINERTDHELIESTRKMLNEIEGGSDE